MTGRDIGEAEHLMSLLYSGDVLPKISAFNGHKGGQMLYVGVGTSQLLWNISASCYFPFWDASHTLSKGEQTVKPEEIKPLLLEFQRVSKACGFTKKIVIDCHGSQWDGVFVIGQHGKYIKGLERFEKCIANRINAKGEDTFTPEYHLNTLLAMPSGSPCAWPKHDRAFVAEMYAGDVVRGIQAFNPERGGRILSVFSRDALSYNAISHFPFWDSPFVQARGDTAIQPHEVKPLILEMQRVSRECGYKQQIDIACRGSRWNFSIGPQGRYIMGLEPFEKWLDSRGLGR